MLNEGELNEDKEDLIEEKEGKIFLFDEGGLFFDVNAGDSDALSGVGFFFNVDLAADSDSFSSPE